MAPSEHTVLTELAAAGLGDGFDPRAVAYTGTDLRRVVLRSGEAVIVKHLDPQGDWLARATGGIGRAQLLWRSGVLSALDPVVEHGVIGVVDYGDHEAIVMRDLSAVLFAPDVVLDEAGVDAVLARMAGFHDFAASLQLPPLCSLRERVGWSDPVFHHNDSGPHRLASGDQMQAVLDLLAERASGTAGACLSSFFDDLDRFERRVLERTERPTLLHGDAKPENLGVGDGRLVAVDWGELTGPGPAEFDVVRFALASSNVHVDLEPMEIIEIYRRHATWPLDSELVRLGLLAVMATNGVGLVSLIQAQKRAEDKQRAKHRLDAALAALRHAFE